MNIEEGNKKIAIKICSGICDGEELSRQDPFITATRETLVGYTTIEKVLEEKQVGNDMEIVANERKVIPEEDEPII